ncbi:MULTISPECIES: hypothetical protein [Halomonadaceae]|uniref:Uncharacterized protein n=1 Tax=Vreelandella halophila TaxID=86177 RepID=A0A9X4YER3_9GAMM|nr:MULTISPECIES: hypothetical protein [Halomonas]MYL28156.1 hypothetical protein [Halomonas utahensis]MYL76063.1 hypothetical protein [Halomonas sp. 22501_18_FS]
MVNAKVVSRFQGAPTRENGGLIQEGPLYPVDEVCQLLDSKGENGVVLWTRDCLRDAQNDGLDCALVADLLRTAVKHGRYKNSQWCEQKPDGPWAACDAYTVICREWIENAGKEMDFEYYLKFAINKHGKCLLVVSCHTSRD